MHQTTRTFLLRSLGYGTETHRVLAIYSINYLQTCFPNSNVAGLTYAENWESKDFDAYASYLDKWPFLCYALAHLRAHYEDCDTQQKPSALVSQLVGQLVVRSASAFIARWIYCEFKDNNPDHAIHLPGYRIFMQDVLDAENHAVRIKYQTLDAAAARKFSTAAEAILTTCNTFEDRLQEITPLMVSAANGCKLAVRLLVNKGKGAIREAVNLALKKL